MKLITKNVIPKNNVTLLITSSTPRSFRLENKSEFPPEIIYAPLSALLLCKSTIAINKIAITNNNPRMNIPP